MAKGMGLVGRPGDYEGWDAWWIEQGPLTLILVPQVGGRIMGIQWHGYELAFVNPECQGHVLDVAAVADVRECKRRLGFRLWGGDKTWLAPQDRWTDEVPFIDLDSGAYELTVNEPDGTVTMTSPVCRETGMQIERTVALGETRGTWTVTHTLRNRSDVAASWALWDVAMVRRPAIVYLPTRKDSQYSQGVRTFEHEGVSAEVRSAVVDILDGFAEITCREPLKFKFGVDAEKACVLALIESDPRGLIAYRKSIPTYHPEPYAHGCVAEVFNSSDYPYFEMELHGPVVSLDPGKAFSLVEDQALSDLDQDLRDSRSVLQYLVP